MDKPKHTPGPWTALRYDSHKPDSHWPGEVVAGNGQKVFAGPFSFHALRGADDEEAEANARLIAAAPSLLEACRLMLLNLNGSLAQVVFAEGVMKQAVARAMGE